MVFGVIICRFAMLHPIPYATPVQRHDLEKNRRGGLIFFGIITLLFGGLTALLTLLAAMASLFTFGPPPHPLHVIFVLAVYGGVTLLGLWVGIGSIRCRRWVRPVVLGLAWPVLVGTLFVLLMWVVFNVDLQNAYAGVSTTKAGQMTQVLWVEAIFGGAILTVGGIIIPGAYLLFYSSRHVRLTLEAYDQNFCWTDRVPLSVFIAATASLLAGLMTLALAQLETAPFFGRYVEGAPALGLTLGATAALIGASILLYCMRSAGWWIALLTSAAGFSSAILTFATQGMMEFYRRGNLGDGELARLANSSNMTGRFPMFLAAAVLALVIGYLLCVHRHFCTKACRS